MEFFIIKNDQQQGPFTLEQLSNMSIMPDTPVWCEGMEDWTTASNVEELKSLVAYAPQANAAQSTVAPSQATPQPPKWNPQSNNQQQTQYNAPQQPYPVTPEPFEQKQRKSHTALWVTLIVLAVMSIILAVTNPDKKAHCRAITNVSKDWIHEKIEDFGGTGIVGSILKMGSTQALRYSIDQFVDVDNYVLCSVGYIDSGDEKSRVSFGIMGHVFTFDKNKIDEKLKEAIGLDDLNFFGNEDEEEDVDNSAVAPPATAQAQPADSTDAVTADDRAEAIFDTPPEIDTLIKSAAKEGAKMAGKAIEKAVDDLFK